MRRLLLAATIASAATAPALAQTPVQTPMQTGAQSVTAGSSIVANVTYCTDETEANNVLVAHRMSGLAAGIDYIVHSPVCRVAIRHFTVLRQLAAYPDLPLAPDKGRRTFYVIEAVDPVGERLFIVTMVQVVAPSV